MEYSLNIASGCSIKRKGHLTVNSHCLRIGHQLCCFYNFSIYTSPENGKKESDKASVLLDVHVSHFRISFSYLPLANIHVLREKPLFLSFISFFESTYKLNTIKLQIC